VANGAQNTSYRNNDKSSHPRTKTPSGWFWGVEEAAGEKRSWKIQRKDEPVSWTKRGHGCSKKRGLVNSPRNKNILKRKGGWQGEPACTRLWRKDFILRVVKGGRTSSQKRKEKTA